MGQFEEMNTACAVWEAMCPEAVDGTLTPAEQRAFDKHVAGCVHCSQELAEAQRGAAWLAMLKGHTPEPPSSLLARILAETTGATPQAATTPAFVPEPSIWNTPRRQPNLWARFSARVLDTFRVENKSVGFQPRFAMTAAMAFFSLALTLNLMGVRLRDVRAGNFRVGQIQRSVADASASATRNFQNLRVVYQLESRVSDLRSHDELPEDRSSAKRPQAVPDKPTEQPKQQPSAPSSEPKGSSDLVVPPVPSKTTGAVRGEV